MKSIIFLISLTALNSLNIKNASEFIEILRNKTIVDEEILEKGLENTKEFLKHYIYYKVSLDPPQPDFNKSYFPKIDIDNLFQNIKTKDANYFDFKNEFFSAVFDLNDLHTRPFFAQIPMAYFTYFSPVSLITKYDKQIGKALMYATFGYNTNNYSLFKNGEHVYETINKNLETPIESINGKDPFTFIQEFSGIKLRNPHSTYIFHQMSYTKNSFTLPIREEELTNFTLVYTNKDTFTTDYLIHDASKNTDDIIFYEDKEENTKFLSYLSEHYNKINPLESNDIFNSKVLKSLDDIILEFEDIYNIQSNNLFLSPNKSKLKQNPIDWKYTFRNQITNQTVFQCRTDDKNQVNVMKIISFGGVKDSIPSLEVAKLCAYLFDENDYKIVIILPRNGGGNPIVGYNIIELLSPYILTRNSLRIKKDINMDLFIETYNQFNLFEEYNTTNKLDGNYFEDGFINETYGNITEEWSKPFAWRVNQTKIEEIKKNFKHKRKPTDIIIMTDSFSYSAASIFLKNVYKSGAGIIIGYDGNPNLPDDIFDISQSPSATFGFNSYEKIYPEIYNNTIKYLMGLATITCMASYHEFQESHIPQEYDVQIVDKRVKLFTSYNDNIYKEFIKEAINELNWYKDNCNPNNKMLVMFSDECKFENNQMHGGFRCGKDSKWNKTDCIPVYCDSGYFYNKISNSCIKYPIEKEDHNETDSDNTDEGDDKSPNDNKTLIIILSAIGSVVVLSILIILIVLYKKKVLCFKKYDINDNINVGENLVPETNEK